MEKIYKIIALDLTCHTLEERNLKSLPSLKTVEKSVVSELENTLNKQCNHDNLWRFEALTTLKFSVGDIEYEKPIVILKNIDHF